MSPSAGARADVIAGFVEIAGVADVNDVETDIVEAEPAFNCWYTLSELTDQ